MKTYKKIMNGVAMVEKLILVLATILIVVLTVGNVLSRKLLHQSWSFTEELVVAVFVLITLMAAALAARDGELVNLSLIPDRLSVKGQKVLLTINTVLSVHLPLYCSNMVWIKLSLSWRTERERSY